MKRRTLTTMDFGPNPQEELFIEVERGTALCTIGLLKTINDGEQYILFTAYTKNSGRIEELPVQILTSISAKITDRLVPNGTIFSVTPPHHHSNSFKITFPLQKKMGFCDSSIVVIYYLLKILGLSEAQARKRIHYFGIEQETQVNRGNKCWMSYSQYMHLNHPLLNP